jgi:hypothetical protein
VKRCFLIAALLAVIAGWAAPPMPSLSGLSSATAMASPQLQTGIVDDSMCLFDRTGTPADLVGYAKDMQSRWIRTNVYVTRVQSGGWKRYDRCVDAVAAAGLHVQLTIACNGVAWTPASYAQFVGQAVAHFKGVVHRISLCNEPNYAGWLKWSDDLPAAWAQRAMYLAAYAAATDVDRTIQVFWGELSSSYDPLGFMSTALCLGDDTQPNCAQPIITDCIAYHPYQEESPDLDVSTDTEVGIGGLWRVQQLVDDAYNAHRLQTPEGGKPPLCLTEFGYQSLSRSRGDLKGRGLSDAVRAAYLTKYIDIACHTKNVAEVILHQIRPSPAGWPGDWDTSLIGKDGKPDLAYNAYVNYLNTHPECVSGI